MLVAAVMASSAQSAVHPSLGPPGLGVCCSPHFSVRGQGTYWWPSHSAAVVGLPTAELSFLLSILFEKGWGVLREEGAVDSVTRDYSVSFEVCTGLAAISINDWTPRYFGPGFVFPGEQET